MDSGYKTDWYYMEDIIGIACNATDRIMEDLEEAGIAHHFNEDEFHDAIRNILEKKAIGYRHHH